jgi:hypothetical protein
MLNFLKRLIYGADSFNNDDARIVFEDGRKKATIYYRKPTGDEVLEYVYANVVSEKSELRELKTAEISAEKMHIMTRRNNLIPFAKKVITRIEGYSDKKKNTNNVEFVEKYFPHHLEAVALYAYKTTDKHKKKD